MTETARAFIIFLRVRNIINIWLKEKAEAEFGDVMFSLINAARLYKINPDNALELTNQKFIRRFNYLEALLAGLVYCAHCGARMSGFMHRDRYKLRYGTVVESVKPKYNCFQRAQKWRDCDGQALYLADRVDGIVLEAGRELFAASQRAPRDKVLEQRIRQDNQGRKKQKDVLEKELRE